MKANYPVSLPVRFEGYPAKIELRCGRLVPAPYSYGSKVTLVQTPLSGVVQGDYAAGSALPDYGMIYSDTGSDTDFSFRLMFYGWGTFYAADNEAACCSLEIRKGTQIEVGGLNKQFEAVDVWETLIPATTDISTLVALQAVAASCVEPYTPEGIPSGYVRIADMYDNPWTSDGDTIKLKGSLYLTGNGELYYKNI